MLRSSVCRRFKQHTSPHVPHLTFITLHYAYFILTCLVAALIFYGSSTPARSVRLIDSVFLAVSAMTEAGLNTVNLSELNTWQQVILFLLIICGSAIFVSSAVIHVRKRAFEMKLQELADRRQKRLLRPLSFTLSSSKRHGDSPYDRRTAEIASGAVRGTVIKERPGDDQQEASLNDRPSLSKEDFSDRTGDPKEPRRHIVFADDVNQPGPIEPSAASRSRRNSISRMLSNTGIGAHNAYAHPRNAAPTIHLEVQSFESKIPSATAPSKLNKYIDTINGYVGRNSQIHHLTEGERRELGGIEYDALCLLSWVVPVYFVLFQLMGAIGCGAWMSINSPDVARKNGKITLNIILRELILSRTESFLDWCFLCSFCVQQFRHGPPRC